MTARNPSSALTVTLPPVSDREVASNLHWLAEHIMSRTGQPLGDAHYAVEYVNDVFEMHPYYWGDCSCGYEKREEAWDAAHPHAATCYQQLILTLGFIDYDDPTHGLTFTQIDEARTAACRKACEQLGINPDAPGLYVHCTCTYNDDYRQWQDANPHPDTCPSVRPNFLHKTSGSTVRFYKYLGRGMELDIRADWRGILQDCADSVPLP